MCRSRRQSARIVMTETVLNFPLMWAERCTPTATNYQKTPTNYASPSDDNQLEHQTSEMAALNALCCSRYAKGKHAAPTIIEKI